MYSRYLIILLCFSVMVACKSSLQDKMIGSWRAIHLENPVMDSFFEKSQKYIDTLGNGNDANGNFKIYGVTNMDSVRKSMQLQHDSAKAMQSEAVLKTVFRFFKDGKAEITMAGRVDTCKWLTDGDNGLILEELEAGNNASVSRYHIVDVNETELKLRFFDEGDSSTVTFKHDDK
jgi:hypothetical protein